MSSYAGFLEQYHLQEEQRLLELLGVRHKVRAALSSMSGQLGIDGRVKTPTSTWRKMQRYGLALDEVHDLIGLRLIVNDVAGCYRALALIKKTWPAKCDRFKDYISLPKPNGYQSIHICVRPGEGLRFEIQIRTNSMHQRCKTGRAAHGRYKRRRGIRNLPIRQSLVSPVQSRSAVA